MPRLSHHDVDRLVAGADDAFSREFDRERRVGRTPRTRRPPEEAPPFRPRTRPNERDPFKCGRCRAFVGPTVSGGRHRNHCPFCLTSRHVDARRPGDRASPCRALMAPVGTSFRPDGEQMVVHRCNGCGIERRTRVAADDDPAALLRLPPIAPTEPGVTVVEEEAIA